MQVTCSQLDLVHDVVHQIATVKNIRLCCLQMGNLIHDVVITQLQKMFVLFAIGENFFSFKLDDVNFKKMIWD